MNFDAVRWYVAVGVSLALPRWITLGSGVIRLAYRQRAGCCLRRRQVRMEGVHRVVRDSGFT
jgi:hypothetical protein